jgi:hypothetical protein
MGIRAPLPLPDQVDVRPAIQQPAMQEWFVLFGDGFAERAPWWHRFLAPGYRHVMALRATWSGSITVLAEHTGGHLVVEVLPEPVNDVVLRYLSLPQVRHALKVAVPNPDHLPGATTLRPPMTCVEAVKALLGIRAPRIIFPRQLARHLRAAGAWDVPTLSLSTAA